MGLLIRLDLNCRVIDLEFFLEKLSDPVEGITRIGISYYMGREDWLSFTERVDMEIVDFVDHRELEREEHIKFDRSLIKSENLRI